MNQQLLHYYTEELAYIRQGMEQFSKRHPHIASGLNLGAGTMEDPHVTRLLESFALLNSRVRCHQDHNFNKLNTALLDILFPHYLAPIPSMAIVQFSTSDNLAKTTSIARGELLETLPVQGTPLNFTTCYSTELLPINIKKFNIDENNNSLKISLNCIDPDKKISNLSLKKLRFFINDSNNGFNLYQQLMENCIAINIKSNNKTIGKYYSDKIKFVGLEDDESMSPWPTVSSPASRLLTEYFTFKEKFLFFDLMLDEKIDQAGNEISIEFRFNEILANNIKQLKSNSLLLNCTPVINLFKKHLEPIAIDHKHYEQPLIVDKRNPKHYEIHTIENVTDITDIDNPYIVPGLYRQDHNSLKDTAWSVQRKYNTVDSHDISTLYLSLSEKNRSRQNKILQTIATCFNDNLPNKLLLDKNKYHLQMIKGKAPLKGIKFVTQPTPVYQRLIDGQKNSHLMAQLANNHLSLVESEQAFQLIKNTLLTCNLGNEENNQVLIDSIDSAESKQIMMRSGNSKLAPYIYGTKMTIRLKTNKLSGHYINLFTKILEKSFSLENNLNSDIQWNFILE